MTDTAAELLATVPGLDGPTRHRLARDAADGRPARVGYHQGGHGGTPSAVTRAAVRAAVAAEADRLEAEAARAVNRLRAWLERDVRKG